MTLTDINLTTAFALVCWPIVVLWLFGTRPVGRAILLAILLGYLLLPVSASIKIKMIPEFDKNSIPALAALFGCLFVARRAIRFNNGFGLAEICVLTLVFAPFVTSSLNGDPMIFEELQLPGLGLYDGGSTSLSHFVFLIPFFLGRQFLRGSSDIAGILRILAVAGLLYSLPILFEARMSPQLNFWIYGTVVRSYIQEVRWGGFRPVVFLGHGLHVAFFVMTTLVAAATLWRTQPRIVRAPASAVVGYLTFILFVCKSAGPMVYAAAIVPLVRWASPRVQLRVAMVLVTLAISYPIIRTMDWVPTATILSVANVASPDRAISLGQRFSNEHRLLQHEWQRFWFGWGRFGRSRVRDSFGNTNSINPDGYWIITMGQFGFIGFIATFGLLGLTVFRAASALKFVQSKQDGYYLSALALIVAISVVNLLPNSDIFPWTWLFAGALLGRAEALRATIRQPFRIQNAMPAAGRTT